MIRLLMRDGRMPFKRLAEQLGVSEAAVRKRVRRLMEEGVIRRFTVEVNPGRLNFKIDAFIGLDAEPETYLEILSRIRGMEEVIHLYSTSGDHMILLEGWFRDLSHLEDFIRRLEEMEGVRRVCPAIILEHLK